MDITDQEAGSEAALDQDFLLVTAPQMLEHQQQADKLSDLCVNINKPGPLDAVECQMLIYLHKIVLKKNVEALFTCKDPCVSVCICMCVFVCVCVCMK